MKLRTKLGKNGVRNDYLKLLIENDFDRPLMEYKKINLIVYWKNFQMFKVIIQRVLEAYVRQNKY